MRPEGCCWGPYAPEGVSSTGYATMRFAEGSILQRGWYLSTEYAARTFAEGRILRCGWDSEICFF